MKHPWVAQQILVKPAASPVAKRPPTTYAQQVAADFGLWLGVVALLQGFRLVLLVWFREQAGEQVGRHHLLRCFYAGLRFDISIAAYACLPVVLLAGLGCLWYLPSLHHRVRAALIACVAGISAVIFPVDLAYFQEYHNQFDHWVWGVVFDDRRAIALTIWKSYPVVGLAFGAVVLAAGFWIGLRWWTDWVARRLPDLSGLAGWRRAAVFVGLLTLFVFGLRGSLGMRPVQLKDAAVSGDVFLDKLVPNPIAALRHSIKDHLRLGKAAGLEVILPGGDIRAAALAVNPLAGPGATVDEILQRTAGGATNPKPRHIFLVVMESYDAWAMQPKFQALHLTDRLQALGRAGIMADGFVSAGPGTMPSLAALICGIPEVGLNPNYRETVRAGVPTAAPRIFKRLGYRTRFFYSGYLSWQRLGAFCLEQGFDEVYGGAMMTEHLTGNEWGVDDEVLYRSILERTADQPTFNVIMTTSYHPPFSVDLKAAGFPLQQLPPELAAYHATPEELHILGHLWYSDRCVGDFADELLRRQPDSLLAITGDHWSRRCLEKRPSIYERRAVPLVLFGPTVLTNMARPPSLAGSHNDILPTLVELVAPTGFVYHAFGRNLLDLSQPQVGFGTGTVVTPEYILEIEPPTGPETLQSEPLPMPEREAALRQRYRQLHALAWWRIIKGNELPTTVATTPQAETPGRTDQVRRE